MNIGKKTLRHLGILKREHASTLQVKEKIIMEIGKYLELNNNKYKS